MNPFRAIFIGLFSLAILTSYAQSPLPKPPIHLLQVNELTLARYTTVWVKGDVNLKNHTRHEQLTNQLLPTSVRHTPGSITLIFDSIKVDNEQYRRAFLINATPDTVSIKRADATLADIRTQVYVNNQWLTLQKDRGASCGNSYWTMPLAPNHHLIVQIEPLSGDLKVPYQLVIKVNNREVKSEPTTVSLTQPLLNLAGTTFSDPWK